MAYRRQDMTTNDWSEIPIGMCLIRMFHERLGTHLLHLHVKQDSSTQWFDQPGVPCFSQGIGSHGEFWTWAEKNLPIWDYPAPVKSGYG